MTINTTFSQLSGITAWSMLKWTYLVVSATFDGTYTNIWATFAEVTDVVLPIENMAVDPIGLEFLSYGGISGDCDIYVSPLMQVDLTNCLPVAASSQYTGGKPIIHAYISGFNSKVNQFSHSISEVSVLKGNPNDTFSDSTGW